MSPHLWQPTPTHYLLPRRRSHPFLRRRAARLGLTTSLIVGLGLPLIMPLKAVTAPAQAASPAAPNPFELSSLDGTNGFVLNGIDEEASSGRVSGAGDVNGDGFDDIIIGAPGADPDSSSGAGESYVVFGQAGGFPARFRLADLDGTNGFVLNGIDVGDNSGVSVSGAGDVNGDGFGDLLIGAYRADPNGVYDAGQSYVVFGAAFDEVPTALTLDTLSAQPAPNVAVGGWLAALLATVSLAWHRLRQR